MNQTQKEKYYEALIRLKEGKRVNVGGSNYIILNPKGLTLVANPDISGTILSISLDLACSMIKTFIEGNTLDVIHEELDKRIKEAEKAFIWHEYT